MLLPGGGRMSWYCRLVRFKTGTFVSGVQSVVVKSEFSCRTKFIAGTSQKNARLPPAAARFNCGEGVVWRIQIPPFREAASNWLPSAEKAAACHCKAGTLLEVHVTPESAEV